MVYPLCRLWFCKPNVPIGTDIRSVAAGMSCNEIPAALRGLCWYAGLAAGFDKDAVAVKGLLGLGFGFIEVGECLSTGMHDFDCRSSRLYTLLRSLLCTMQNRSSSMQEQVLYLAESTASLGGCQAVDMLHSDLCDAFQPAVLPHYVTYSSYLSCTSACATA